MTARTQRLPVFLCAGLLVGLLGSSTWAQSDREQEMRDMTEEEARIRERVMTLESSMTKWMDKAGVPGVALGGVWRGEPAGVGSWGVGNDMMGTPVDEWTVFSAASLTKPVVAYLVLQLVDEGLLELDQALGDIWMHPKLVDDPLAGKITVRMILSHCSGLPNWAWNKPLKVQFEPGTRYQYSGEGFVWLSRVVEEVTGEPLEVLAKKRVFKALKMKNTSLVWADRFADNFAVGHREDGQAMEPNMEDEPNAAASLLTTARDYSLFMAAAINGKGLSAEMAEAWFTPQTKVADNVTWGLGWGLQETKAGRAVFQWGDNPGYKAFVTVNLEDKSGVVVFTNSDNGMAMMSEVVTTAMGANQPGFEWLGYESFNSPRREVRRILDRVLDNEGTDAAIAEYHSLKRRYPEEAFQEGLLNSLGYSLMAEERWPEAIQIFALNVKEYPEAFNPYDSLGEAYMRNGDVEEAIESYERSVELNPDNANGVQMLSELRKKLQ